MCVCVCVCVCVCNIIYYLSFIMCMCTSVLICITTFVQIMISEIDKRCGLLRGFIFCFRIFKTSLSILKTLRLYLDSFVIERFRVHLSCIHIIGRLILTI